LVIQCIYELTAETTSAKIKNPEQRIDSTKKLRTH
jgi:hypothetical protein